MAEVLLNIKNVPKVMKPTQDDVVVFNGKDWYITSKESLFAEAYKLIGECNAELEKVKKENSDFKKSVAKQLVELSELVEKLYKK